MPKVNGNNALQGLHILVDLKTIRLKVQKEGKKEKEHHFDYMVRHSASEVEFGTRVILARSSKEAIKEFESWLFSSYWNAPHQYRLSSVDGGAPASNVLVQNFNWDDAWTTYKFLLKKDAGEEIRIIVDTDLAKAKETLSKWLKWGVGSEGVSGFKLVSIERGPLQGEGGSAEEKELGKEYTCGKESGYPESIEKSPPLKALFDKLQDESLVLKLHEIIHKTKKDEWRGHLIKERELFYAIKSALSQDDDLSKEIFEIVKNQDEYVAKHDGSPPSREKWGQQPTIQQKLEDLLGNDVSVRKTSSPFVFESVPKSRKKSKTISAASEQRLAKMKISASFKNALRAEMRSTGEDEFWAEYEAAASAMGLPVEQYFAEVECDFLEGEQD